MVSIGGSAVVGNPRARLMYIRTLLLERCECYCPCLSIHACDQVGIGVSNVWRGEAGSLVSVLTMASMGGIAQVRGLLAKRSTIIPKRWL